MRIRQRRDRLPSPVFLDFPCDSAGKESTCNVGDLGLISGLGRSPGEGKGYPLHYSGLENSKVPTPLFWSGEFQGLYSPWGRKELDMTEQLSPSTWRQVPPLLALPPAHKGCPLGPLILSSGHPSPNLSPAKVLLILQMAAQMSLPLASFT